MIERIEKNEELLDGILDNIKKLEIELQNLKNNKTKISIINKYYGSKNWFKDKEAYESNKISKIKAGILSEDTVWNMNENISDLLLEMQEIIKIFSSAKNNF